MTIYFPHPFSFGRRRTSRGTAEIELLLCILVLISILMLVAASAKIGAARLDAVETAAYQALGNAATGRTPMYTGDADLPEVTTEWDIRPGLPNRTHVSRTSAVVPIFAGADTSVQPAKISAVSGAIGPAWTMSAYPVGGSDAGMTFSWFDEYISESHPQLIPPLLMAPSWTP